MINGGVLDGYQIQQHSLSGLTMSTNPRFPVYSAILLGLAIPFAFLILKKWSASKTTGAGTRSSLSEHANPEQPLLPIPLDEADPLLQAEVYVAFGRKRGAQAVLETAIEDGCLTLEDADLFWAKHELKKSNSAISKAASESRH